MKLDNLSTNFNDIIYIYITSVLVLISIKMYSCIQMNGYNITVISAVDETSLENAYLKFSAKIDAPAPTIGVIVIIF